MNAIRIIIFVFHDSSDEKVRFHNVMEDFNIKYGLKKIICKLQKIKMNNYGEPKKIDYAT
jgi:hypothetical protein